MSFQKDYENYLCHSGFISEEELAHFGVPGMKWGVRKSTYKSLNRRQRKALKAYSTTGAYTEQMRSASKNKRLSSERRKKASAYVKNADAYRGKLESVLGTKINNKSSYGSAMNSALLNKFFGAGLAGIGVNAVTRRIRANKQRNMSDKDLKNYLGNKKEKKK